MEAWRSARVRMFSAKLKPSLAFALPFPCCESRSARAPKLSRRAKGEFGGRLFELGLVTSSSSKGLSLTEAEHEVAEEMLAPRLLSDVIDEAGLGDEPDSPRVVKERRRRLAWAAAAEMGPW